MRRLGIVLILMILPCVGAAQSITVQTGEHAGFTRVVVTIPSGIDWRLGRNQDGYLLRLPGTDGFDLSNFFDLIPRGRISEVSQDAEKGELQFFVACPCFADAFTDSPNILVIDIRTGVAPLDANFEQPIDPLPVGLVKISVVPPYDVPRNRLLPLVPKDTSNAGDPRPASAVAPLADIVETSLMTVHPVVENVGLEPIPVADLNALKQSITESLARGLSQGLLDPDLDEMGADVQTNILQALLPPGVAARTSVDVAAVPPNPRVEITQQGQICLPDAFFDVGNWGDDRSFSDQMSEARSDLTGEFDRTNEAAIVKTARLFVFFGFGREAIQTLSLDPANSQERQYLTAIAQLIDGDPVDAGQFDNQVSCATSVALWALLSRGKDGLDGKVDAATVLRAFKALPPGLQLHLGPLLSGRFLAIDDEESALQALAFATSAERTTVDARIAKTALLQDLGEYGAVLADLTELARTDARITPDAMVAFLQSAKDENLVVEEADFLLVDALRFENATLPVSVELGLAQIWTYLRQDQFLAAHSVMQEVAPALDQTQQDAVINHFADAATARMDDSNFLAFAFDETAEPSVEAVKNFMARRLLDLGFPDRALELLTVSTLPEVEISRSYMRAEAALLRGNAEKALEHLSERETTQGRLLLQVAQDLQAGVIDAPQLLMASGAPDELWRRGDWQALSELDDSLLRDASVAVLEQPEGPRKSDAPLAQGRLLLGQSEQTRVVVNRLLDRFEIPVEF